MQFRTCLQFRHCFQFSIFITLSVIYLRFLLVEKIFSVVLNTCVYIPRSDLAWCLILSDKPCCKHYRIFQLMFGISVVFSEVWLLNKMAIMVYGCITEVLIKFHSQKEMLILLDTFYTTECYYLHVEQLVLILTIEWHSFRACCYMSLMNSLAVFYQVLCFSFFTRYCPLNHVKKMQFDIFSQGMLTWKRCRVAFFFFAFLNKKYIIN